MNIVCKKGNCMVFIKKYNDNRYKIFYIEGDKIDKIENKNSIDIEGYIRREYTITKSKSILLFTNEDITEDITIHQCGDRFMLEKCDNKEEEYKIINLTQFVQLIVDSVKNNFKIYGMEEV